MLSRSRSGKAFLSLEADETLLPPCVVGTSAQVACLSLSRRLLVFGVDELKLQPKGGRGLTLIDLEARDKLVSIAAFGHALQLLGSGRGGKARDETLKATALTTYRGKRARKGKALDVTMTVTCVMGV